MIEDLRAAGPTNNRNAHATANRSREFPAGVKAFRRGRRRGLQPERFRIFMQGSDCLAIPVDDLSCVILHLQWRMDHHFESLVDHPGGVTVAYSESGVWRFGDRFVQDPVAG